MMMILRYCGRKLACLQHSHLSDFSCLGSMLACYYRTTQKNGQRYGKHAVQIDERIMPERTLMNPDSASLPKKVSKTKCPHGRRRWQCRDCKGSSICIHSRLKTQCRPCDGASICFHGHRRSTCRLCIGVTICCHNRERQQCEPCGGVSLCTHRKIRSHCKYCGGVSVCPHGKLRSTCIECGGGSICPHGKRRSNCPLCSCRLWVKQNTRKLYDLFCHFVCARILT